MKSDFLEKAVVTHLGNHDKKSYPIMIGRAKTCPIRILVMIDTQACSLLIALPRFISCKP